MPINNYPKRHTQLCSLSPETSLSIITPSCEGPYQACLWSYPNFMMDSGLVNTSTTCTGTSTTPFSILSWTCSPWVYNIIKFEIARFNCLCTLKDNVYTTVLVIFYWVFSNGFVEVIFWHLEDGLLNLILWKSLRNLCWVFWFLMFDQNTKHYNSIKQRYD